MAQCSLCDGTGKSEEGGTCTRCDGSGREEEVENGRCSVCGAPLTWNGSRYVEDYTCSNNCCSSHW